MIEVDHRIEIERSTDVELCGFKFGMNVQPALGSEKTNACCRYSIPDSVAKKEVLSMGIAPNVFPVF